MNKDERRRRTAGRCAVLVFIDLRPRSASRLQGSKALARFARAWGGRHNVGIGAHYPANFCRRFSLPRRGKPGLAQT